MNTKNKQPRTLIDSPLITMTTMELCYYDLVYLPVIYLSDLPEVYLWDLDVAIVLRFFLALQGKLIASIWKH